MTRAKLLVVCCGLGLGGIGLVVLAEQPTATRPVAKEPFRGYPATLPSGGRGMPGERVKSGPWRGGPGDGFRAGWPDAIFDPGRPGQGRGGMNEQTLSPQERQELLAFLGKHFPEMHGRVLRFQKEDPTRYGLAMRRLMGPVRKMMNLSKTDPKLAEVVIAEHQVELRIAELPPLVGDQSKAGERAAVRAKLRELVEKRFDLRQQRLTMEIEGMRRRLDEARARLSQQAANRTQLIEGEVHRVMNRLGSESQGKPRYAPDNSGAHAVPVEPSLHPGQR